MKREGRQHGSVRTLSIKFPTKPDQTRPGPSLATHGVFTRVSARPTNHSKPTGKCNRPRCATCHLHPSWKSKDKIKGARRLRAADVDTGHGGLQYKVKLGAYTAREILDEFLVGDYCEDDHHDDISLCYDLDYSFYGYNGFRHGNDGDSLVVSMHLDSLVEYPFISGPSSRAVTEIDEDTDSGSGFSEVDLNVLDQDGDGDEEDYMGYIDVAIVWEAIDGEEGWALIGEM